MNGNSSRPSLSVNFTIAIPAQAHKAFAGQRLSDTTSSKRKVADFEFFSPMVDCNEMTVAGCEKFSSSFEQDNSIAVNARKKADSLKRIGSFWAMTVEWGETLHGGVRWSLTGSMADIKSKLYYYKRSLLSIEGFICNL